MQESGYQVTYCEKTDKNHFPFGQRNLYTRTTSKGIDVFAEVALYKDKNENYIEGFSYIRFGYIKDYETFQKGYELRNGRTIYSAWALAGFLGVIGSGISSFAIAPVYFLGVIGSGFAGLVWPISLHVKLADKMKQKFESLPIELRPRDAIRSALDFKEKETDEVIVLQGRAVGPEGN